MSRIPTAVREKVARRSKGRCEGCGAAGGRHIHHRSPRGMGGGDGHNLANLMHLCVGCHMCVESEREVALRSGWLIPLGESAFAHTYRVKYRGHWVHLLDDGTID